VFIVLIDGFVGVFDDVYVFVLFVFDDVEFVGVD